MVSGPGNPIEAVCREAINLDNKGAAPTGSACLAIWGTRDVSEKSF